MNRLEGKICLITGGARGQGEAEARLFSAEGGKVWICDVLDSEGEALANEINCHYRHLDVRDEAAWQTLVDEIVAVDGGIDVLINNAGIFRANRLVTTDMEEFQLVMDVNCTGVFLGMRTVATPMMASGGGSIVNISSLAGLRAAVGAFAYGASKWAVRGMTKTASVEFARKGIRVNSIHPGLIETPMAEQLGNLEKISKRTPLGRVAEASEVASLALFLASEESSYSTGSEFIVDGGLNAL
ncbi:MAG: SDR family oxidoreductase [bacterium]|nr:SDR family oxidoreductase [Gammaproteobacteria bacterium]HIL95927.1 SDR family oxidoreductase [Pseudomonadales bacterium]